MACVLILSGAGAKVTDLGLSLSEVEVADAVSRQALEELAAGTPAYLPPEAKHGHISVKTDSYALGIILLELLSGLTPVQSGGKGPELREYMEPAMQVGGLVGGPGVRGSGGWVGLG